MGRELLCSLIDERLSNLKSSRRLQLCFYDRTQFILNLDSKMYEQEPCAIKIQEHNIFTKSSTALRSHQLPPKLTSKLTIKQSLIISNRLTTISSHDMWTEYNRTLVQISVTLSINQPHIESFCYIPLLNALQFTGTQ